MERFETDLLESTRDVLALDMRPEEQAMMTACVKIGHLRIKDRNQARARDELVKAMENFDRSVKDPLWLRAYPVWRRVFIIDCKTVVEKVKKLVMFSSPHELDILEDAIKTGLAQRLAIPAKDMHVVADKGKKQEEKKEDQKALPNSVFDT